MSCRHCHRCIQLLTTRKGNLITGGRWNRCHFRCAAKRTISQNVFRWWQLLIFAAQNLCYFHIENFVAGGNFFILDRHFLKTYLAKFEPSTCSEQSANQKCNIAWQYCKVARKRTTGFTVTSVNCQTLRVRCEKEAAKPMFIDSHLFSSIFRGLIFYKLHPEKQNAAQLTVME